MNEKTTPAQKEGQKKVVVVSIAVIALVVILIVFFTGKQLVGKAVAGITSTGTLAANSPGVVKITVPAGTNQVDSFQFEITSAQVQLCNDGVVLVQVVNTYSPDCFGCQTTCTAQGGLRMDGAFFSLQAGATPPSGNVDLAQLTFTVPSTQSIVFHFNDLQVFDDGQNIISAQDDITLTVQQEPGAVCDNTHPGLCITQATCTATDNFWNTNTCVDQCPQGTEADTNDVCVQTSDSCPTADQQCPEWFETNKDTKCSAWLSTLSTMDLNSKLTSAQKTALCAGATSTDFNADLNNDGKISNDDVVIMQLALEAMDPNLEPTKPACGKTGEVYCNFNNLIWVCENLKSTTTNPGDLKC